MQRDEVVEDTTVVVPRMDAGGQEVKEDNAMDTRARRHRQRRTAHHVKREQNGNLKWRLR